MKYILEECDRVMDRQVSKTPEIEPEVGSCECDLGDVHLLRLPPSTIGGERSDVYMNISR
jgi:hypothetical protein